MSIQISCPHCQADYSVREEFRGKSLRCKSCQGVFAAVTIMPSGSSARQPDTAAWYANGNGDSPAEEAREVRPAAGPARKKARNDEEGERESRPKKSGVGIGVLLAAMTASFFLGAVLSGVLSAVLTRVLFPRVVTVTAPEPLAALQVQDPGPKPAPVEEKSGGTSDTKPPADGATVPGGGPQPVPAASPDFVEGAAVLLPISPVIGQPTTYQLPVDPPNSTFQLLSGHANLSVTPGGVLSWTPIANAFGTRQFTVRLSYPGGARVRRYQVNVREPQQVVNNPAPGPIMPGPNVPNVGTPLTHGSTLPQKAIAGKPFALTLPSPRGDRYELVQGPAGMTLTDGVLRWTPGPGLARRERVHLRVNNFQQVVVWLDIEADDTSTLTLGRPGGWVMLPDGVTLIVSQTDQGKLVWIDTMSNKEIRSIDLPFKPAALTYQGKQLIVGADGAARAHILDLDSGAVKKEVKIPEGAVFDLACHPNKGLVYATTTSKRIVALNPETGTATATKARGMFLAMDPVRGDTLYAGIQPEMHDVLVIRELSRNRFTLSKGITGSQALLAKFAIKDAGLSVVGVNPNTASNGYLVRVSPDGDRVGVVGGGGYRAGPDAPRGSIQPYSIGLFSREDISSLSGLVTVGAYPHDLAFHPVLDIGVAEQDSVNQKRLHLFNSKSLAEITTIELAGQIPGSGPAGTFHRESRLLTFGARGTKVLYYSTSGKLHAVPLNLSEADRAKLAEKYPQ